MVKVKVKLSLLQAYVAQRVGRGIALLFLDRGTRRGWVVSSTPRPHFALGKDPVPILQEAGWAPGPVWKGGKSRPQRDSIPDRPACSQSLYRLSYPAHNNNVVGAQIYVLGATIPSLSVGLQNFVWREITEEYGILSEVNLFRNVKEQKGRSTRWRCWLRPWAISRKVAGSIPDGVIGFFIDLIFRQHYDPGIDLTSDGNEYYEYVLGVKAAGA
jgi:hypothetical protein